MKRKASLLNVIDDNALGYGCNQMTSKCWFWSLEAPTRQRQFKRWAMTSSKIMTCFPKFWKNFPSFRSRISRIKGFWQTWTQEIYNRDCIWCRKTLTIKRNRLKLIETSMAFYQILERWFLKHTNTQTYVKNLYRLTKRMQYSTLQPDKKAVPIDSYLNI